MPSRAGFLSEGSRAQQRISQDGDEEPGPVGGCLQPLMLDLTEHILVELDLLFSYPWTKKKGKT